MRKHSDFVDAIDLIVSQGAARGLLYRTAEDESLDGRLIRLDGRDLVNFSSCSYLGLEMDERLKEGGIDAIRRFGTQFSSSRAYVSMPLYQELEADLERVFGVAPIIAPTTSLAHVAALPVLIHDDDLVLADQQVHTSVQNALNHVRVHGTRVEVLRHSRMDLLEKRLEATKHQGRVWYMADGLYSMYGDFAPLAELEALLAKYEHLHLYLDDAHAMSWHGPHGRGYATELVKHPRVVVATSLNKAFAAGGGTLLVNDAELRHKIRKVGASLMFSGPLQPANLGVGIASARLHASGEIHALQAALADRIRLCNQLCEAYGLPLYSLADVPIRFIAMGHTRAVFSVVERLKDEGFYVNAAIFPSVWMTRAGIRFTLTLHQTLEDIERLIQAIARHLPGALATEGSSLTEVRQAFGLPPAPEPTAMPELTRVVPAAGLNLEHHHTIEALDAAEWDRLLGAEGTFTASGLRYLERTFQGHERPEENWRFHYYVVRDAEGAPVLATFFTEALWKDDMMAAAELSERIEREREREPYHLTSWTLAMGSLLTEGQHLYLDRSRDWQAALTLLLSEVERERERCDAAMVALRDLDPADEALGAFLLARGYARFLMPESAWMTLGVPDEAAHRAGLSLNARKHQRKKVMPFDDHYTVEVVGHGGRSLTEAELAHCHRLYLAVKDRNLSFNCFALPTSLLVQMQDFPEWEILLLRLKPELGGPSDGLPVAFMANFRGPEHYVPMVCGLDYRFVESHGAYRQLLRHAVKRAQAGGFSRLYFGIGAAYEKSRFGAQIRAHHVYVKYGNDYGMEVLRELMLTTPRTQRATGARA